MYKSVLTILLNIVLITIWINLPVQYGGGGDIDTIINNMGFYYIQPNDQMFLFGFVLLYCTIFGLIVDNFLGRFSFGPVLYCMFSIPAIGLTFNYMYKIYGYYHDKDVYLIFMLVLVPPFVVVLVLALMGYAANLFIAFLLKSGKTNIGKRPYISADGGPSASRLRSVSRHK